MYFFSFNYLLDCHLCAFIMLFSWLAGSRSKPNVIDVQQRGLNRDCTACK